MAMRIPAFLYPIAAGLLLAALGGCKDESTTVVYTPYPASYGGFPGAPLATSNLGADGKAFSDPGFHFTAIRRFDSGRGESVFLFEANTDWPGGSALFASHFDGATFTRPVELRGRNQDAGAKANLNQAFVAFLFPGAARDGDACIGFVHLDADDAGGSAALGPNRRLYVSYFDRSERPSAEKTGDASVRYGFETDCAPIDLTDDANFAGANVDLAGFVSDGTIGATEFPMVLSGPNTVRQGNATTFLAFFWAQAASLADPVRLHAATFDLTGANTGNQFGAPAAIGLDAGALATDTVDVTAANALRGVLFFRRSDGVDTHLLAAVFDSAAATPGFAANAFDLCPSGSFVDTAWLPGAQGLFGAEAGLTRVVGVFRFTGGTVDAENSLYAFQVDPSNPSAAFAAANDRVEIDNGTGSAGSPYGVNFVAKSAPVLNRTGEWIAVPWIQDQSTALATPALWVRVLLAPRTATPGALTAAVSAAPLRVDQAATTVADYTVQADVRYAGFQSSRNVFSLAWQQDAPGTTDTLRFNSVTVTVATPPTAACGSEGTIPFNDATLQIAKVVVADGGGAGGTAGAPILYYLRDARTTSPSSIRAFQYRSGVGETEIGTLTSATAGTYHCAEATDLRVVTTPAGMDVGACPDWAGRWHHVVLVEYRFQDTSGSMALRHRMFDKDSTEASSSARFHPSADGVTPPLTVDTGLSLNPLWLAIGLSGDTLGLFFHQADHVWYNEFDPGARKWLQTVALVDDLYMEPVFAGGVMFPCRRDSADTLKGAVVFWAKNFTTAGPPLLRLFVRARY